MAVLECVGKKLFGNYIKKRSDARLNELIEQGIYEFKDNFFIHTDTLEALSKQWGNRKDIKDSLLIEVAQKCLNKLNPDLHDLNSPSPRVSPQVLTCGARFSSLVIGMQTLALDCAFTCLEHAERRSQYFNHALSVSSVLKDGVAVIKSPLRSYDDFGDYLWYSASEDVLPKQIELVICNGPVNHKYGLMPRIEANLAKNATILVNEAHKQSEKKAIDSWREQFRLELVKIHGNESFQVAELKFEKT